MNFQISAPHPALQKHVIRYWQVTYPRHLKHQGYSLKIPAIISQDILFNLVRTFKSTDQNGKVREVPRNSIVSHSTGPVLVEGLHDAFCIHFFDTAIYRLWGLPISQFVDEPIDLKDVFGNRLDELTEKIHLANSFKERVQLTNFFLIEELVNSTNETPLIDRSLREIKASGGFVQVQNLAEAAGLSSRQFQRRFIQQVGLSPKKYSNIMRINFLIKHISCLEETDWQDLVHHYQYFDQSHLDKDFKRFTGMCPTEFFEINHNKLLKHMVAQKESHS